jgi:hypothetical protein
MRWRSLALAVAVSLVAAVPAVGQPKPCDIDVQPAATLLIPYFEVTLANPIPGSTLVAVTNAQPATRIAHVTLWTDYAIPTVNFDVVLAANDVQTFDVVNIFTKDQILTATAPGCTGTLQPGILHYYAPLLRDLPADATQEQRRERLIEAHSGEAFDLPTGEYVASSFHPGVVIGYITIDVVNRCATSFPSTAGYFRKGAARVASDENALVGDVLWTDYASGIAYGEPAVHIRAHPTAFKKTDYTFYARYLSSSSTDKDNRQALGRIWGNRFLVGPVGTSPTNSYLVVWRDTKWKSVALPTATAGAPGWWPLPFTSFADWNEAAASAGNSLDAEALALATQRVDLGDLGLYNPTAPFGWMKMDLGHTKAPLFKDDAQAWVTWMADASNFPVSGANAGMACRSFTFTNRCK